MYDILQSNPDTMIQGSVLGGGGMKSWDETMGPSWAPQSSAPSLGISWDDDSNLHGKMPKFMATSHQPDCITVHLPQE